MLEMEPSERMATQNTTARHHDTKRFRLRAISHESEIYQRYFNCVLARKLSLAQFILGVLICITQVTISTTLQMKRGDKESIVETVSWITWSGYFVSSTAALTTFWASGKPSYAKLHTSMALNIISVFIQGGVFYLLRKLQFPELIRMRSTTEIPVYTDGSELNLLTGSHYLIVSCIIGTTVLSSLVILQGFLSIFIAFQTGRAICCGRSHLEGRFLEMEAVTKDKDNSTDAIVNFRMGRRDSSLPSSPNHSPPPPPYIPPPQFCERREMKE